MFEHSNLANILVNKKIYIKQKKITQGVAIGGQMGHAKWAGPRHGDFGPAQARHGTEINGPCRGTGPVVPGPASDLRHAGRHGTARLAFFYLFFNFFTYFYFFFNFWATFTLNGPCPTGQTCLTGRRRASRAVPEVWPRPVGRPGTA